MATFKAAVNKTNHFVLVLDASGSMSTWKKQVIAVADNLVSYLATESQTLEQEARITVYAFSGWREIECLIYDMDVLRLPSIETLYSTYNMTALLDATHLAIDDLKMTPEKYGDHAFVIYVLTDGIENNSRLASASSMSTKISGLPENWSLGVFVPDKNSVDYAKRCGFPADNIAVWDATSVAGFEKAGQTLRDTSSAFMQGRRQGVRGTKNLFTMKTVSVGDIQSQLRVLPASQYVLASVVSDSRIDDFVVNRLNVPYRVGHAYYQHTKTEIIQPNKLIAVLVHSTGQVHTGTREEVGRLLGLPDSKEKIRPGDHPGYTIFVQSTALNRKVLAGTTVLVLR